VSKFNKITKNMKSAELLSVLLLSAFLLPTVSSQSIITLDGTKATHVYTGHGGLSAGASSRLLIDYPESQRNDILDMLFLPQHGMNLHLLKVEIGGDAQSTDGTEPSHQHSREDLSCTRGYELFLLREAKKRNPEIITYGLSWGAPGFINNGTSFFGEEMMKYQTQWVECIQQELGFVIDYLGIYNERYWGGVDYVKGLRSTLDSKGFQNTKIVLPDGGYDASILTYAATDSIFNSSFDVIGLHYPCNDVHPEVAQAGKSYWASEHWWDQPDFNGASTWGHLLNYNWVAMNMTSTISWSPLWSVYTNLEDQAAGLMLANEPWSGHWKISPPIWTSAQWLQFTKPGWKFLSVSSSGSGHLPFGGTYVSLIPPTDIGLTLILETFGSQSARCGEADAKVIQNITFVLENSPLPITPGSILHVWQTNSSSYFIQLDDILVGTDSSFSISIAPFTMMTITSVSGGKKGSPQSVIPPSSPFPLPYVDDFTDYIYDSLAHYFSDQFGSFAVRNGTLVQVAPMNPGKLAWSGDTDPFSLIGDINWKDITVSVDVVIPNNTTDTSIYPIYRDGLPALLTPCDDSSVEQKWILDAVATGYVSNTDSSGSQQCLNAYGCGREAVYWSCVTTGGTCCGAECYDGLIFTINKETNQIISKLSSVGCLTAETSSGNGKSLTFSTCASANSVPSNQTFLYNSISGHIELSTTGLCLSQPPPPPPPTRYAQVCTRIASYTAFQKPKPPPGFCLAVALDGTSQWTMTSKSGILANGTLSNALIPGTIVKLSIVTSGSNITSYANNTLLASLISMEHTYGMTGVGTSFDSIAFESFSVV
jgi:galactosylceramidase